MTVLQQIRAADPKARVLVMSNFEGTEHIASALSEGALGYIFKDSSPEELMAAIEAVANGRQFLARRAARALNERTSTESLTPRELDVLELLVRGHSNQAIADALGIAEKTVRAHMTGILAKLQATDRTHAAVIALQQGFVTPPAVTDSVPQD
jgi:DNA-binding NarL/FixJ family response regulator